MATAGPASLARAAVGLAVGALAGVLTRDLDLLTLVSFWGDRVFVVLLGGGVGALLWRGRLRLVVAGATVLLAAMWLATAGTPFVSWLGEGLVRRDTPRPADAVFVFGSRVQKDGEATDEALSRLVRGLELVGSGLAPRLVVSEQPAPARAYLPIARSLAGALGLRAELLAVGPIVNTHDEAVALAALARAQGFSRVLAVTSPVHTRRACAALEAQGLETTCVPSVETRYDLETLDRPAERLRALGPALHERLGLLVYRRRGWIR